MIVYTLDGEFIKYPEILHKGKDFFRKMTNSTIEKRLCEILMKNYHKNIIKIYGIYEDYIDMELLDIDIDKENINKIKNAMIDVKTYLQKLGIVYIDWKLDNIGINNNGHIKLFDFNASGLINIETKEWIKKAPLYWSHREAIINSMKMPIDIDNYAFNIEFTHTKYITDLSIFDKN